MTGDRMIARFSKGSGWSYNIGERITLGPKCAQDILTHVYGLGFHEAREKMKHARAADGRPVALPPREKVPA